MSEGPIRWSSPATITRIARAGARIRILWDIELAAHRMGHNVDRSTPLTRAHYVEAYHKLFDPPLDPCYILNLAAPPPHRPAVNLVQLRPL